MAGSEGTASVRHVVLLLHDGCELIDFAGPAAVFGAVRTRRGRPAYRVTVASRTPSGVRLAAGIVVAVDASPRALPDAFDTLVVPGGSRAADAARDTALLNDVRTLAPRARRVVAVSSGAILLAAAGLLHGRRATSHWTALDRLRRDYPSVDVATDVLWVRDGDVYTSAGATTCVDLALALVEEDHGAAVADEVAGWLLVPVRRPAGQAPRSVRMSLPPPATAGLRHALDLAALDPGADLSVRALAERAALSPRHFSRRFQAELGTTPARYVEGVRVEAARRLLEQSGGTLDVVARAAGFRSVETMRRAFLRTLGVPPGALRRSELA
jgi:transcriptional regulator GlxA family with amidase domain